MKKYFLGFLLFTAALSAEVEEVYPTVILGGGVGGLTSALYLSRAGVTPLVIEGSKPGGALAQSPRVQNWPGELEITGADLIDKLKSQAVSNGAKFLSEEVVEVDFTKRPFQITTKSLFGKETYHKFKAQTAIIAMGTTPRFLNVPGEQGEEGYWSKGVYSCAVCDGSLFKNKTVAVVGGGDAAITEAHYLSDIADKVFVIVRGKEFKTLENQRKETLLTKPNVEVIYESNVKEIKGNGDSVTHIVIQKKKKVENIPVNGVFLAVGSTPNSKFLKNQVELDKNGFVLLKKQQETSSPGVFAIGDIADPIYQQAVSAAGDGAKAAMQAKSFLSSLPPLEKAKLIPQDQVAENIESIDVIEIESASQFHQELKNSKTPIIVDFYATWCGPCKNFAPFFDRFAHTFSGKIKFLKVNVDVGDELARQYQIKGIPSLVVFDKNGNLLSKKTGSNEINELTTSLEPYSQQTAAQIELFLKKK